MFATDGCVSTGRISLFTVFIHSAGNLKPQISSFTVLLFFGEVNRTITFGILYCLWKMHHSGVCFQPRRGEVVLVAALVCTVATYHLRAKRKNQKWSKSGPIHSYSPGLDLAQLFFAWKPLTWKADTRGEGRASYFEARGHWPICWRVADENVSWIINESLTCPAQDIYNIPKAHSSSFMWQNMKQVAQSWSTLIPDRDILHLLCRLINMCWQSKSSGMWRGARRQGRKGFSNLQCVLALREAALFCADF